MKALAYYLAFGLGTPIAAGLIYLGSSWLATAPVKNLLAFVIVCLILLGLCAGYFARNLPRL